MRSLKRTYRALLGAYGPQGWWPAETAAEVIVGAVLVQRTAWRNAELAIENLRAAGLIDPVSLVDRSRRRLETLIRPAGFYRAKAGTLRALGGRIRDAGGLDALAGLETTALRRLLMGVSGIGPETADSILLYAFARPVVVVDAYMRRIVGRMNAVDLRPHGEDDERLRAVTATALLTADELNEFHALLVRHGKEHCRARPDCTSCVLIRSCATGLSGEAFGRR